MLIAIWNAIIPQRITIIWLLNNIVKLWTKIIITNKTIQLNKLTIIRADNEDNFVET